MMNLIKHFVQQALSGCLETCQYMVYRHIEIEKGCPRFGVDEESITRMLFECPPALQSWTLSSILSAPISFHSSFLFYNIDYLFWRTNETWAGNADLHSLSCIFLFIWKPRHKKFLIICVNLHQTHYAMLRIKHKCGVQLILERKLRQETWSLRETAAGIATSIAALKISRCQIEGSWKDSYHMDNGIRA